jgi:hypothetical protein
MARHVQYLRLWTQMVGKIRLAQTPWVNHSWHVALCVTARGLTTSPIPYGAGAFEVDFDFRSCAVGSQQRRRRTPAHAAPKSVAEFYEGDLAGFEGSMQRSWCCLR